MFFLTKGSTNEVQMYKRKVLQKRWSIGATRCRIPRCSKMHLCGGMDIKAESIMETICMATYIRQNTNKKIEAHL